MSRGGGGGRQAGDPVPSGDEVFDWCDGSYAEYATAGEDHFAPKPTTASRFVLAEFTDENYQVVWWIMAKLGVVVAVLVAFVAGPQGLVRSIPRRSAEPEPEHTGLLIMRWSSMATASVTCTLGSDQLGGSQPLVGVLAVS